MGLVQTTNTGYWRNFGCFRVFSVPFETVLPAFFGEEHVFDFEKIKFSDMQQLSFLGSVELENSFWVVQTHAC